jgi:hypothetical protein
MENSNASSLHVEQEQSGTTSMKRAILIMLSQTQLAKEMLLIKQITQANKIHNQTIIHSRTITRNQTITHNQTIILSQTRNQQHHHQIAILNQHRLQITAQVTTATHQVTIQ